MTDNLSGKIDKAKRVIKLAAAMSKEYYGKPLIICYSGGKDSDVLLDIAIKSGAEIEVVNSHTTADAPETVYHIRNVFKRLRGGGIEATELKPTYKGKPVSMWSLIPQKQYPPTRIARYCCSILKEASTPNRIIAVGVREDESIGRRGRGEFVMRGKTKKYDLNFTLNHAEEVYQESHEYGDAFDCTLITRMKQNADVVVNPIYEFSELDIWKYIAINGVDVCELYERGYRRVGCIGCPFAGRETREKEFDDFPAYKKMYIHAFDRMLCEMDKHGKDRTWKSGQEVFDFWISGESATKPKQMSIQDYIRSDDD